MVRPLVTPTRRFAATLALFAFSAFACGFIAANARAANPDPTAAPISKTCSPCRDTCYLDVGEWRVHKIRKDYPDKFCIDFDRDGIAHCCETMVQVNEIWGTTPPDRTPSVIGYCERPVCTQATPGPLVCKHPLPV